MNFIIKSFAAFLCFALLGMAHAGPIDDSADNTSYAPACFINIQENYVNVNYIRLVKLKRDSNQEDGVFFIVNVSLASNYSSDMSNIEIKYKDLKGAKKATDIIVKNLNNCRQIASQTK